MSDMRFWYPASIAQITEINESFDSCLLYVCYPGKNRNKTIISKASIEKATPTMAYCPIVANYNIEENSIGGHDVEFMEGDDGKLRMVNMTDACGVVPENPEWKWETLIDKNGDEREYLVTPAILWKRTPVYAKLKRDGVSGQSMEIGVKEGKLVDGDFEIDDFYFKAFCLLGEGVEPCFESARIEVFSQDKLSERFGEMMGELKQAFSSVMAASADDINTPGGEKVQLKGGDVSLNIDALMEKYGLNAEDINFEMDGKSEEEIETLFAEIKQVKYADEGSEEGGEAGGSNDSSDGGDGEAGGSNDGDDGDTPDDGDAESDAPIEDDDDDLPSEQRRNFQLTNEQLTREICIALGEVTYTDEWGEWGRYGYADRDDEKNEVYAYDYVDWNLYGFTYTMNGDRVVIDFESKKRMRLAYVEFDMGEADFSYKLMLEGAESRFSKIAGEVKELRKFKNSTEASKYEADVAKVFANFDDLKEDQRFIELMSSYSGMSVQDIEDKCFAIRGRNAQVKFSLDGQRSTRLPVERGMTKDADEPYGGVFLEYGVGNR